MGYRDAHGNEVRRLIVLGAKTPMVISFGFYGFSLDGVVYDWVPACAGMKEKRGRGDDWKEKRG